MDIKEIIKDAVEKLMEDDNLRKQFMDDPVKALEKVLNIDLPDDLINPVIDGIKAKLTVDAVSDIAGDAAKLFKKLF